MGRQSPPNHKLHTSDVMLWVCTSTGIPLGEGRIAWKPVMSAEDLVQEKATYWATTIRA